MGVLSTLVGRNEGLCPALRTNPQALPLFPSFLQNYLVAPVGIMELEGQSPPGVDGRVQLG